MRAVETHILAYFTQCSLYSIVNEILHIIFEVLLTSVTIVSASAAITRSLRKL